jgi:hypothetical protein
MKRRFTGVSSNPNGTGYLAAIKFQGRLYRAGSWPTAREAAIARDRALLHFDPTAERLNLPRESRALGPASPHELQRAAQLQRKRAAGNASLYLGVSFDRDVGRWRAEVHARGKKYTVGGYTTERDAAIARDRLALHAQSQNTALNFPELELSPASPQELRIELGRVPERPRSSRYLGVGAQTQTGLWHAQIYVEDELHLVSGYRTQRAAAEARDRMALYLLGSEARLNFPKLELEAASPEELRNQQYALFKSRTASRYSGVTAFPEQHLAWYAELRVGNRRYVLGRWETERAAAIAVDRARLFYAGGMETGRGRVNFPKLSHRLMPADAATLRAEAHAVFKARTTSRFRGVYRSSRTGRWASKIMVNRKTFHLGSFDDEIDAALAYDRAAERLLGDRAKLNFEVELGEERR